MFGIAQAANSFDSIVIAGSSKATSNVVNSVALSRASFTVSKPSLYGYGLVAPAPSALNG